jgi:hypothetical protein
MLASGINYEQNGQTSNINNPLNFIPNGQPAFSSDPPPDSFNITQTDHILCIWSQCQFRLTVLGNTCGNFIVINETPVFPTLADITNIAPVLGVDLTDNNETQLTPQQVVYLATVASAQLVRLINNNIVISTYMHEEIGRNTGTLRLKAVPVINYDMPQVRRPYIIGITSILITKSPVAYQVDRQLGLLNYRFTNDLIEISEPFQQYNEIKCTYRAGYLNIPQLIKEKVIQLMGLSLEDINVNILKGGSGSVTFFKPIETYRWIIMLLREYNRSSA